MISSRRPFTVSSYSMVWLQIVLFLLVYVPVFLFFPKNVRGDEAMDLVYLLDVSGSMVDTDPDLSLKDSVLQCTGKFSGKIRRVAVVPFSNILPSEYPLTSPSDGGSEGLTSYMNTLVYTHGDTDIGQGLARALKLLTGEGTGVENDRRIILVTDGVIDLPHTEDEQAAEKDSLTKALVSAEEARAERIRIDTVGIGDPQKIDENLLGYLADRTGGSFAMTMPGSELTGTLSALVARDAILPAEETETETEAEMKKQQEIQSLTETETEHLQETETETEAGTEEDIAEGFFMEQTETPANPVTGASGLTVILPSLAVILLAAALFCQAAMRGRNSLFRGDVMSRGSGPEPTPGGSLYLRFYVKMENQKIFGVPTQNIAALPPAGKVVKLSDLVDDPYLETAGTGRVTLRSGKKGTVLVSKTGECLIKDQAGNTVKSLALTEGCRFRIFCATDMGTAVIVAVCSSGTQTRAASSEEEERTRLLV